MYQQTKKTPALRFPEFHGTWQIVSLGDLARKISDGMHSTPVYDECGEYYFVNGNNLLNGRIVVTENTKTIPEAEYRKHRKDLDHNSILLSINGTIGSLALFNNEKIVLGKSACYINLDSRSDRIFIYNILQTTRVRNHFWSELTGSTIKNLSLATIKNCELYIPLFPEQQKIAAFLLAVDEKIGQLTLKKELLLKYKKGVMQQIFSQKIRFKDDNGNNFPDWASTRVSDVSQINPPSGEVPDTFVYIDLESVEGGSLNKETFLRRDEAPSRAQRVLQKGDILFQLVRPYQSNNLIFDRDGSFVASTGYAQLRSRIDARFLFQSLLTDSFVKNVVRRCTGTSYPAISSEDLAEIKIDIPVRPEQEKIGEFLTQVDNKIGLMGQQIQRTMAFKRGLLQRMFV